MKTFYKSHEFNLFLILLAFSIIAGSLNPAYLGIENLFKTLKSSVEMGIFALSFLIILVMGGIDMSFPAIASASMYITIKILMGTTYEYPLILPFLMSGAVGAGFGVLNGILIGLLDLPTLIVTLGTMSIIKGFLLVFVGKDWITQLPDVLISFSKTNMLEVAARNGESHGLHISVLILVFLCAIVWALLKFTWYGRSIYAIGGNPVTAKRSGIGIKRVKFFAFVFAGFLGGVAGLVHCSLVRVANPFDIFGTELNVIAAVVLGGAALTGGFGTVPGTVLGVLLINVVNNSLILLGIPSYGQKVVVGLIVILSTIIAANQSRFRLFHRRQQV